MFNYHPFSNTSVQFESAKVKAIGLYITPSDILAKQSASRTNTLGEGVALGFYVHFDRDINVSGVKGAFSSERDWVDEVVTGRNRIEIVPLEDNGTLSSLPSYYYALGRWSSENYVFQDSFKRVLSESTVWFNSNDPMRDSGFNHLRFKKYKARIWTISNDRTVYVTNWTILNYDGIKYNSNHSYSRPFWISREELTFRPFTDTNDPNDYPPIWDDWMVAFGSNSLTGISFTDEGDDRLLIKTKTAVSGERNIQYAQKQLITDVNANVDNCLCKLHCHTDQFQGTYIRNSAEMERVSSKLAYFKHSFRVIDKRAYRRLDHFDGFTFGRVISNSPRTVSPVLGARVYKPNSTKTHYYGQIKNSISENTFTRIPTIGSEQWLTGDRDFQNIITQGDRHWVIGTLDGWIENLQTGSTYRLNIKEANEVYREYDKVTSSTPASRPKPVVPSQPAQPVPAKPVPTPVQPSTPPRPVTPPVAPPAPRPVQPTPVSPPAPKPVTPPPPPQPKPVERVIKPGYVALDEYPYHEIFLIENIVVPTAGDTVDRYKAKMRMYIGVRKDRLKRDADFTGTTKTSDGLLIGTNSTVDTTYHIRYNVFGFQKEFNYANLNFFDWTPELNMPGARTTLSPKLREQLSHYDFRVFSIEDTPKDFIDIENLGASRVDVFIRANIKGMESAAVDTISGYRTIVRTIYPEADKNGVRDRFDLIMHGDLSKTTSSPDMQVVYDRATRHLEFKLVRPASWGSASDIGADLFGNDTFMLRFADIIDSKRRIHPSYRIRENISYRKIGSNEIIRIPFNLDYFINDPATKNNDVYFQVAFASPAFEARGFRHGTGFEEVLGMVYLSAKARVIVKG